MAKLKLIKYHPLFAYSVGDVFEVNKGDSDYLLKNEYAVLASKADADKADEEEFARLEAKEAETADAKIASQKAVKEIKK